MTTAVEMAIKVRWYRIGEMERNRERGGGVLTQYSTTIIITVIVIMVVNTINMIMITIEIRI